MSYKTYIQSGTPQTRQAREDQVENNAGGYVFKIDPLKQLQRFLILGTVGGTYYKSEAEMTFDNIEALKKLFDDPDTGRKAVDLIVEISESGRAPKNDPALAALALASVSKNQSVRTYAISKINSVARIPTHLFHLAAYREAFGGGWGRTFKGAIQDWYNSKDPENLSFLMAKYQSRDGWCHKDLLRLSHPVPASERHNILYKWALGTQGVDTFGMVNGLEEMKMLMAELKSADVYPWAADNQAKKHIIERAINLIDHYKMPFEVVPTELLKEPQIWAHLVPNLGYTSLVRSLARMAQAGFLVADNRAAVEAVVSRLENDEALKKSRLHPIAILSALRTYSDGRGVRSNRTWETSPEVVCALEKAFYNSFRYIEPTGKRYLIGVDVSASMDWGNIAGVPGLTPRDAAAVMAMVFLRSEERVKIVGFSHQLVDLPLDKNMSLNDVSMVMRRIPMGRTDCSKPIRFATKNKLDVDVFMTLTDNETWYGSSHPFYLLKHYRQLSGIDARNIVIGFTATRFSIADPNDPLSLDIVGFDSAVPQIVSEFVAGRI